MKFIFLDIDGVLNNRASLTRDGFMSIDPACLDQLERITKACPDAKVILSSTWRLIGDSKEFATAKLAERGIEIFDSTPDFRGTQIRGSEINDFLERAQPIFTEQMPQFVILDDDSDMLSWQLPFFVQTNMKEGLTKDLADKAIEILLAS